MLLNQLVQEHHPVHAEGAAVNDNAEPVSGVVLKAPADPARATAEQAAAEGGAPVSRADLRTHAMHRFLSAQTDVSEEVRELYKLVCTGFR